jgi:hypothetical protein
MTEGEESYERVVAQLAQMPDVIAQLLRHHEAEADGKGRCRACTKGGTGLRSSRTHALSRASRVRHWRSARTASGEPWPPPRRPRWRDHSDPMMLLRRRGQDGNRSRPRSRARTEWVSAPTAR